jgi:uncharacterized membrane protein (DUF485 family)
MLRFCAAHSCGVSPQELADQAQTESTEPADSFDWWSAPPAARARQQTRKPEQHEPFPDAALDLAPESARESDPDPEPDAAEIYRAVHDSPEFREIRTRYRRFVFPATGAFLLWYLLYVVLAVTAPQLMARPIAGPFNTAWLLGLLQFASTFLLTWLYARHARDHRDRAALGLRWETQDRLR